MLKTTSLRDDLDAAGLFERHEARTWAKLAFFVALIGLLLTAHAQWLSLWASILLVPLTGALCGVAAMLGHEGSHGGFSSRPWRNQLIFSLTFPLLGGVSGLYWHWKHDTQHHANPNVIDVDPDILLWPMACSADEYRRSSRPRQWYQRHLQGLSFWPLCLLLIWAMRASSIAFLCRYARTKGVDRAWLKDVCSLAVHFSAWVIIPCTLFGPAALVLYVGVWTVAGGVLAIVFAPAHVGMPLVTETRDTWRLQLETTRDLQLPRWLSFFFIGLDYQVEHHLFPRMPHQNLRKAAKITRDWAARHNVPHHDLSYWESIKDVTRHMGKCWQFEAQPCTSLHPRGPCASVTGTATRLSAVKQAKTF